jgi:uncharacterized membrane protein
LPIGPVRISRWLERRAGFGRLTESGEKSVMQTEHDIVPPSPPRAALIFPETRTEFVNLMAHYYRGEMGRMTSWRDRVDRTSNWAITVVAAFHSSGALYGVLVRSWRDRSALGSGFAMLAPASIGTTGAR